MNRLHVSKDDRARRCLNVKRAVAALVLGLSTMASGALAKFDGCHFWINHGFGNSDAAATYDEVRIWKGALPDRQLTLNAQSGSDVIPEYVDVPQLVLSRSHWSGTPFGRTGEGQ